MVSKNISKRVVDLLNYKFLKMVYIPYFLNFVSIILYSSKKKRTSRLQSASQNSSRLLILVSSNPSLIFKSSIRTNNRTITNQPWQETKASLRIGEGKNSCKKDDSFKEASTRNIVTAKSYVVCKLSDLYTWKKKKKKKESRL